MIIISMNHSCHIAQSVLCPAIGPDLTASPFATRATVPATHVWPGKELRDSMDPIPAPPDSPLSFPMTRDRLMGCLFMTPVKEADRLGSQFLFHRERQGKHKDLTGRMHVCETSVWSKRRLRDDDVGANRRIHLFGESRSVPPKIVYLSTRSHNAYIAF